MNEISFNYSTFTNSSNLSLEHLQYPSVQFGIAKIICALPGLFINIIFIISVLGNRRFRKNLVLLSLLSFGDLLCSANVLSVGLSEVISNGNLFHLTNYECFYKRPHMALIVFCTHIESVATVLVAVERAIAIWFPYHYNKCQRDNFILCSCLLCMCIAVASFVASIIVSVRRGPFVVFMDMCYPSVVVSTEYSGFVFMLTILLGSIALVIYLTLFATVLCKKTVSSIPNSNVIVQKRQTWLLKISSILAFSSFVFIVIPYTILYVGRKDWTQNSFVGIVRNYVSYMMAANSFIGIALCMVASKEMRMAVKATIFCKNVERSVQKSSRNKTQISFVSTTSFDNTVSADEQV